jgi:cell wall assembly regulator SMI1
MTAAADLLRQVIAALESHWPPGVTFPEPAKDDEIQATERHVGQAFPQALIELYRAHNGGPTITDDPSAGNLFYNYRFLSLSQVRHDFSVWEDVRRPPSFDPPVPSIPSGVIREHYSLREWVAFGQDGGGNAVAIDYAPGPEGKVGQVITFGPDEQANFRLGVDLEDFLRGVLAAYQAKRGHHLFGEHSPITERLMRGH